MSKIADFISKGFVVVTIVLACYRDAFTNAPNDELSFYLVAGMLCAIAIKYVWVKK